MINPNFIVIFSKETFCWSHVIIPAIISGLITFYAVWWTNKKNTERWENDTVQKHKIELLLNIIDLLSKTYNIIYNIVCNQKEENISSMEDEDFKIISELVKHYMSYHWISKDKYIVESLHLISDIKFIFEHVFEEIKSLVSIKKNSENYEFDITKCFRIPITLTKIKNENINSVVIVNSQNAIEIIEERNKKLYDLLQYILLKYNLR